MSRALQKPLNLERQLSVFKSITTALMLEPTQFLKVVCRLLAQALEVPQTDFAQLSSDHNYLLVVAEYRSDSTSALGRQILLEGDDLAQQLVRDKQPVVVLDASIESPRVREILEKYGVVSKLVVPVVLGTEVFGTLALDSFESRIFGAQETEFVQTIANLAAPFMANARLIEHLSTEL